MPSRLRHCLILSAALLCAACAAPDAADRHPTAAAPSAAESGIQSELRKSVATLQPLLPLRVGDGGELIGISTYDLILELTFQFRRKNFAATPQQDEFAINAAKRAVDTMGCGNRSIATWLAQDVTVRYRFLDQDDRLFFAHDLRQDNCSTAS